VVDRDQAVERCLEDRTLQALARAELLDDLLAAGDVGGNTGRAIRFAGIIEDGKSARVDPAQLAVRAHDAKLMIESREPVLDGRPGALEIERMDRLGPRGRDCRTSFGRSGPRSARRRGLT
jgi:hypothetical protein